MYRFIDQLNVSITTNRSCTLKCQHCYIDPELFKSKERISIDNYKKIFDQVESLLELDKRLKTVEWEVIGGETTMMPFEFWEEMLPFTLNRIAEINKKCEKAGSLNFLTNLIYKDKRYTELFNQYGNHELFCLYTSWEPDTNRFGNNNKLYPQFKKNLLEISAREKILDLILTKTVCSMNPEDIINEFSPLGINDYSIKQLSPYGSGKQFFDDHMTDFKDMSNFLIRFQHAKNRNGATFTPMEEMYGALCHGSAFQCNGNFKYDLSIEPNGLTHFNANQTKNDMVTGFRPIYISDKDWATKVLFENSIEETNKLTLKRAECDQCEYLRFCNAGWYHYKLLPEEIYRQFAKNECAGFKSVWELASQAGYNNSQTDKKHLKRLTDLTKQIKQPLTYPIKESALSEYDDYLSAISNTQLLIMERGTKFGKAPLNRMIAYESLGLKYQIPKFNLLSPDLNIVGHLFSGMLPNAIFDKQEVWEIVKLFKKERGMHEIVGAYNHIINLLSLINHSRIDETLDEKVFVDERNEELFIFLLKNFFYDDIKAGQLEKKYAEEGSEYLYKLSSHVFIEVMIENANNSNS